MTGQRAILAAGCFWGVEAALQKTPGVTATRAGYSGGRTPRPTYEQVCAGASGHAEAVEVFFDEKLLPYRQLLDVFWRLHDPTQLNRQGPDVGEQYRSAIFYIGEAQRIAAELSRREEQKRRRRPIVTVIAAAGDFWPAEEYHQSYVRKRQALGRR